MMHRLSAFILLMMLSVWPAYAEPAWTHSYEEAKLRAQKENKYILIMLSKEECDACWYMENVVFTDEKVQELMKKFFIPVYIDINIDTVSEEFEYIGTPTLHFRDMNGTQISHPHSGAIKRKEFVQKLEGMIKAP